MHQEGEQKRRSSFFQNVLPFTCTPNINCFLFKIASPLACFSLPTYAYKHKQKHKSADASETQTTKCFEPCDCDYNLNILYACATSENQADGTFQYHIFKNLTYKKSFNNKNYKSIISLEIQPILLSCAHERGILWKECLHNNVNQLFDRLAFFVSNQSKTK